MDPEREYLPLTGERTVPGIAVENYWLRRHEAAYRLVLPVCRHAAVLDAGCGEGYGAALVAAAARSVVALDYDAATVAHAATRYRQLHVVRGNVVDLPLAAASVDAVVALQVIEHLWDQPRFVDECARVLRPGGMLLLSTPNRLTFSPGDLPGTQPRNPFHTRELSPAELAGLLPPTLEPRSMVGLRHGPRLVEADRRHGGLVSAQLAGPPEQWSPRLHADVATVGVADFEAVGVADFEAVGVADFEAVGGADFAVTDADLESALDLLLTAVRR